MYQVDNIGQILYYTFKNFDYIICDTNICSFEQIVREETPWWTACFIKNSHILVPWSRLSWLQYLIRCRYWGCSAKPSGFAGGSGGGVAEWANPAACGEVWDEGYGACDDELGGGFRSKRPLCALFAWGVDSSMALWARPDVTHYLNFLRPCRKLNGGPPALLE